ncbi:hypothetical protein CAC42_1577 [Sphaceloma murrayae]|uniref:Efficient mitochondria targeting-associated protein 19 n=1 Tax=Sphaceloma murrayae TaxID=2082308 RepID=A0A2K1R3F1_9PEZI|nr:hypothetical protein CAC42_1577 [Sphaceloma murrayae]
MSRKIDLIYMIFFAIHLIVMFNVDLHPLWPASIRPAYMDSLRQWYVTTYRDQFFVAPPAWFDLYMYLELIYHVPLCLWAIPALLNDDRRIPVQLLVYAVETGVTTLTCIADYMSWKAVSWDEKLELGKLYVPYLAVSVFMGIDMIQRLNVAVSGRRQPVTASGKKQR